MQRKLKQSQARSQSPTQPLVESLERRTHLSVSATFTSGAGILNVFGDSLNNTITISRDAAGKILVNGGAVSVSGGVPTAANTVLSSIFGQAANDPIPQNEPHGS